MRVKAYLRVHHIRSHIRISDVLSKLAAEFGLDLLKVKRLHRSTWTAVNARLVPNDLGAQRLWEASYRLSEIALEEFYNRGREIQLRSTIKNIFFREGVGSHPLGKVANNLRGRRDFDNVSALMMA